MLSVMDTRVTGGSGIRCLLAIPRAVHLENLHFFVSRIIAISILACRILQLSRLGKPQANTRERCDHRTDSQQRPWKCLALGEGEAMAPPGTEKQEEPSATTNSSKLLRPVSITASLCGSCSSSNSNNNDDV